MSQDEKKVPRQVQRMQKKDRLFNDMVPTIGLVTVRQQRKWRPSTDVYETEESIVVKVEIAGMSEEDFSVSLSNRNLVISGVRRDQGYKLSYQQLEIPYGNFSTEVFLPYAVDRDEIRATYENGFLTVLLPKARVHRVQVVDRSAEGQHSEE
jgi:HSP20 family protein